MNLNARFLFLSLTLFIVAVSNGSTEEESTSNSVSSGLNTFAVTLLKLLYNEKPDNLILSPLSIGAALGMISEGAKENTYTEIADLLSLPQDEISKRQGFQEIFTAIKERNSINSVYIGDRAYIDDGIAIRSEFLQTIKTYYDADAETLDFSQNDLASGTINNWVSNVTDNRITDIVNSDSVTEKTKLVLVNAVYFNGTWNKEFYSERTSVEPFYRSEEDKSNVHMMAANEFFRAVELEELNATAVEIPYKNNEYIMLVVLPRAVDGLPEMLDMMCNVSTLEIRKQMQNRKVNMKFPRFKMDSKIDLMDPLTKLGVDDMFDSVKANFTGITTAEEKDLYVSSAVHKAEIETTETGTVASAATVISFSHKTALVSPLPPIPFIADHPFVFFIQDGKTDVPLFAGVVTRPTEASEAV